MARYVTKLLIYLPKNSAHLRKVLELVVSPAFQNTESILIDDSFGSETKSLGGRKCARYSCGNTSPQVSLTTSVFMGLNVILANSFHVSRLA